MTSPRTVVIGIGQPLGGDDAVGLLVATRLNETGVPALRVQDGAALAELLAGVERAVLIDAVVGGGAPGTVIVLGADELEAAAGRAAIPVSTHGVSIASALAVARALGGAAEAHLVGIAIDPPAGIATSLSEPVAAAVEAAARTVRELLCDEVRDLLRDA